MSHLGHQSRKRLSCGKGRICGSSRTSQQKGALLWEGICMSHLGHPSKREFSCGKGHICGSSTVGHPSKREFSCGKGHICGSSTVGHPSKRELSCGKGHICGSSRTSEWNISALFTPSPQIYSLASSSSSTLSAQHVLCSGLLCI